MRVQTWAVQVAGMGAVLLAFACGTPPRPGGGPSSQRKADGGVVEPTDAGTPPPRDPLPDGGVPDAGVPDGGVPDAGPPAEGVWTYPPLQTSVPEYQLVMTDAQLQHFHDDPNAPEIQATFIAGGVSYPAMVRLRGASARLFPKKSWNVDLGDGRFEGRRRLNLVAEYQDQTLLVEKWGYDLLEAMGIPAPRAKYVRVRVNGKYEGVFVDLEQVDKHFTRARDLFRDDDATIYRCGWKDNELKTWRVGYQGDWNKKTNEDEPKDDVHALMAVLNHSAEAEFAARAAEHLELDHFLRSMAVDVLISNNYVEDSESYLVHDRVRGKWSYVPWDLNNSDARWWPTYSLDAPESVYFDHPLFNFTLLDPVVEERYAQRSGMYPGYLPVFSNLGTRIAFHPELRAKLEAHLVKAQQELFAPELAHRRIEAMYALIAPHMTGADADHRDPYFDLQKFKLGPEYLRRFITARNRFITSELERLKKRSGPLRLTGVHPAEGWVELTNVSSAPVSLAGKTLTNNLRQPLLRNLPEKTLAPGATARFDMAALGVPLAATGEVGVFDGQHLTGVYDLLFYGPASGGGNVHHRDGEGRWLVR